MTATVFKEKYMPYHQKMFRIASRLLEDNNDAEDIVQEAYIKLWNKRDELSHVENTESYCVVILKNLCLDFLRSKSRHVMQSTEEVVVPEEKILINEIENTDEVNYIKMLIEQLPEQQRQIVKLRHFDEYSNEEIEEIMGLTSVNTRVLLSRARKKIKEMYINKLDYHGK